MNERIFLYGTLLPNCSPREVSHVTDALRPVATGTMNGRVFDLGEYPGAIFDPSATSRVRGRVFEMPSDAQLLAQLDRYEEYTPENIDESLFVRKECPVRLDTGVEMLCWVYLYNRDLCDATAISSGDYASWIADRAHGLMRGGESSLAEADYLWRSESARR